MIVAVCCGVLHRVAVWISVLQPHHVLRPRRWSGTVCCSELQCVWRCVAVWCSVLLRVAVCHDQVVGVACSNVCCSALQCVAVCCRVLRGAVC